MWIELTWCIFEGCIRLQSIIPRATMLLAWRISLYLHKWNWHMLILLMVGEMSILEIFGLFSSIVLTNESIIWILWVAGLKLAFKLLQQIRIRPISFFWLKIGCYRVLVVVHKVMPPLLFLVLSLVKMTLQRLVLVGIIWDHQVRILAS